MVFPGYATHLGIFYNQFPSFFEFWLVRRCYPHLETSFDAVCTPSFPLLANRINRLPGWNDACRDNLQYHMVVISVRSIPGCAPHLGLLYNQFPWFFGFWPVLGCYLYLRTSFNEVCAPVLPLLATDINRVSA